MLRGMTGVMSSDPQLEHFALLGSWGDYKGYPRPFVIPGCHIMHRRDIEWKFGAFCPVSAVDAGDV